MIRTLLALLLVTLPVTAQAQNFPPLSGRVVDAANLLSPEQEAQLTQLSQEIEKASSRQFVVATIPDLQGYPIEDYGVGLGRAWKIGQKDANNGIILIVAPNDRKVRIEVGYGLEPIMTDAYAGMIIDNLILPKFRNKDMAGGIMAGASAIGDQMKLPLEAAEARAKEQLAKQHQAKRRNGGGIGIFVGIFVLFMIFAVVLPAIFGRRRGRRYRGVGGDVGNILLWTALDAAMRGGRSGGSSWGGGGGGWGGGGGGGFSGGGGSFGGGGASGGW
ncbi:TPM domain-containing protein [Sphingomonas sp. LB-2]|uniref:TPM domain-containing protein n=1 Tax=Sphingomonas caeni TaxID=2984949 RepID=UPI00222F1793|nr:TPM domain-containing protein [Sphingomonas caeni]MCW3847032.1 TPM domain-containing protein [Sphingomonas caeni]